jgi:hypothetical protein
MGPRVIGDLVAHARREHVGAPAAQLDVELPFQAEEDVALRSATNRECRPVFE